MLHNNSHSYEFGPYRLDVDQRDSFDCQPNHLDNGELIDEWKLPRQVLSGEPSTAEQLQVLAAIDDSIQTLVHRQ